ncbi:MAG TPA: amidase, partial [Vicinamibacteria bacterium]|nr:amidase [Vicinamibacteria bacterium]
SAQRGPSSAVRIEEITIREIHAALKDRRLTCVGLVDWYLRRIEAYDKQGPALNAVIRLNPNAVSEAQALDAERRASRPRGPLHGIPVLLKDNVDTADRMTTTAGSLALAGSIPDRDAYLAARLRAAGAVLLGKANMSEWANIRSTRSSSGWSARGGQARNPYVLDRNPCGSSSGSAAAVSANLAPLAIGTETDGSIVCPSSANGIVGIKPTLGLVSRAGIIPIAHSQDTAGPMARTVRDAAVLLSFLTGADPRDAATAASAGHVQPDYARFCDERGLQGARIGVARKFFGRDARVDGLMEAALQVMKSAGAVLVDPVELSTGSDYEETELEVLLYELKADLNAYLAATPRARVRTLADVIRFNEENREVEMPYFGQELFLQAQEKGGLDTPAYRKALENNRRRSRTEGLDAVLAKHRLDAVVGPTGGPAWLTDLVNGDHFTGVSSSTPPAVAGYPALTVPAGFVFGLPVGITFMGAAWSEPALIRLAYAYEQQTRHRTPPRLLPSVPL